MHICGPRLQRLSNFVNAGFATQTAQSRYSSAPELQSPMIEQLAVRASGLAVQRTITITYGFAVWTQLARQRTAQRVELIIFFLYSLCLPQHPPQHRVWLQANVRDRPRPRQGVCGRIPEARISIQATAPCASRCASRLRAQNGVRHGAESGDLLFLVGLALGHRALAFGEPSADLNRHFAGAGQRHRVDATEAHLGLLLRQLAPVDEYPAFVPPLSKTR